MLRNAGACAPADRHFGCGALPCGGGQTMPSGSFSTPAGAVTTASSVAAAPVAVLPGSAPSAAAVAHRSWACQSGGALRVPVRAPCRAPPFLRAERAVSIPGPGQSVTRPVVLVYPSLVSLCREMVCLGAATRAAGFGHSRWQDVVPSRGKARLAPRHTAPAAGVSCRQRSPCR